MIDPCPLCKSTAELKESARGRGFWVQCTSKGKNCVSIIVIGGPRKLAKKAIKDWNMGARARVRGEW